MSLLQELTKLSVERAAKRLLGCELARTLNGNTITVKIVETEAYDQTDAASHSYKGKTQRTDVMFGPAGHLYVYFTYGMHYCANIVVGEEGYGAAVLIRAVEPLTGEELLAKNRPSKTGIELTNGPAKWCQALKVNKQLNGHNLSKGELRLKATSPLPKNEIITTERIGISQAKDVKWRFYIKDNPYVSR